MKSLTDMVGDLGVSTEQVLTALRIVAARAGVEELAEWAAKELEGYEEDDKLPKNRIWRLSIVASFHNPAQGSVQNAHVGDFAIDKKYRKQVTTHYCREGVGQIENLLSSDEGQPMSVEHPNLAQLINKGPMVRNAGWLCTHAAAQFSPMHLKTIVNKARQTALKLCLECESKGVSLRYMAADDSTTTQGRAWMDTLRQEGTKVVIRDVWAIIRAFAMGG